MFEKKLLARIPTCIYCSMERVSTAEDGHSLGLLTPLPVVKRKYHVHQDSGRLPKALNQHKAYDI